jgi:hypothetical protein
MTWFNCTKRFLRRRCLCTYFWEEDVCQLPPWNLVKHRSFWEIRVHKKKLSSKTTLKIELWYCRNVRNCSLHILKFLCLLNVNQSLVEEKSYCKYAHKHLLLRNMYTNYSLWWRLSEPQSQVRHRFSIVPCKHDTV